MKIYDSVSIEAYNAKHLWISWILNGYLSLFSLRVPTMSNTKKSNS
jgi:hypothetical protein